MAFRVLLFLRLRASRYAFFEVMYVFEDMLGLKDRSAQARWPILLFLPA